ncbi:MAG: alanine--tRNA ligase [Armatimonadetes bacterium]|nr:alanine--tRNA ligase [Armatimonadota bacterium]
MLSSELRERFLRFFEGKGCLVAPSDSLVPDDPTLLFSSAGMVQFKPYFVGDRVPPRTRMATAQKCLRTGDLEVVGTTPFHHTFFEMMGNFSFGDYFKDEAISWAWEFLTEVVGFEPDDLWVTVFQTDDEAYGIWHDKIGIPAGRIVRLGEKSNYWPANAPSEGPNGPCGPCSEIFFDFGKDVGCGWPECNPDCDCARFSEVWNLVFMQYNREEGGVLTPLPKKNIDTGMGLERVSAVLQRTPTNFETDLFKPIIDTISEISGKKYAAGNHEADVAFRVIADHIRAMVFCLADGVMPSNVGRGYVLRRVIRRAVLKGRLLELDESFLDKLVPVVVAIMQGAYPELEERQGHITRTLSAEEEKFRRTLEMGMQKLDECIEALLASKKAEMPGMEAFVLYDTFGFPLELTQEIAGERGIAVDVPGFDEAMDAQRRRAREGSDISTDVFAGSLGALAEIEKAEPETEFVGYQAFESLSRIVGILRDGELVDSAQSGDKVDLVLDKTPFYAESGGQVSDVGTVSGDGGELAVEHAAKVGSLVIHSGSVTSGEIKSGEHATARIDARRRMATMRNHTATHLLHKALRTVLGDHVVQSGSLVEPGRLRFDFSHFQAVAPDELAEVEKIVNRAILDDLDLSISETTLEQAREDGAMALFGEKYGGVVRVVRIGDFSVELCGGTHVGRSSQIGLCRILSESSVGAGLRRIEAVTGEGALDHICERERLLASAAEMLKVSPAGVPEAVERMLESARSAERRVEELQKQAAASHAGGLASRAVDCGGVSFLAAKVETSDADQMSSMADRLAESMESAVIVLAGPSDGKVMFVAKVTPDLVKRGFHAGNLVREIAKVAGGGGGGRPDFAQAGGRDASKLDEALSRAEELVRGQAGG